MSYRLMGILGGTFDPIHNGHCALATNILAHYPINEIRFIPCKVPVLKPNAQACVSDRLAMLKLALANQPNTLIDTRELDRTTPSYMVDTLVSLKSDFSEQTLCLILGMDSYLTLPQWHQSDTISKLAHLIVCQRPGYQSQLVHPNWQLATDLRSLSQYTSGFVSFTDFAPINISATQIRLFFQSGQPELAQRYLPPHIHQYIKENSLYGAKL